MQVTFIHADERRTTVEAAQGETLLQLALSNGIDEIIGECGGSAMCATCHVYVADDWLAKVPAIQDVEEAMLDSTAAPRQAGSRLGCQIIVTEGLDGLIVQLPESQY